MTIHIVTEEVTLRSKVLISAPAGERPERVVEMAMEKVQSVRENIGFIAQPTDLFIESPVYQENRHWLILITISLKTTDIAEIP